MIAIQNIKCRGCANTIEKGVLSIDEVSKVSAGLETSKVTVDTANESVMVSVKKKLAAMGYPEVGNANTVLHKATSFVSCASGRIGEK
jgi:copper chaperone CopZ